ncbi:MAG: homoserine dehydrogenase [Bacillota bacterium]|nr:homoserine dehydrogenase [Bacillota bacterium]
MQIAIMGYGVVGTGVAEVICTHAEGLKKRAQEEIEIKYILDIREFPDSPLADKFTKSFDDIINDDEVKVVVEVMGGLTPAFDYVKRCLESGKSVVTSNKELVAAKGAELLKIALEKNVNFLFEASVGGGIPIIRPISQCLAANEVDEIIGILNGTTNFILTKMIREQMNFQDALSLAQSLGYAERNPAADVEGGDTCRKICILASLTFGKHVYPETVYTEGITNITLEDVEYAAAFGSVIKLIGRVKMLDNGKMDIVTAPMLISRDSQLASVDDVFNGIMVRGDATGDVLFYGKGAGKLPTASAVVADVIDCVKHQHARKYLFWADGKPEDVLPFGESFTRLYVRCESDNKEQAFKDSENALTHIKRIYRDGEEDKEFAFVTCEDSYKNLLKSIASLEEKGVTVLSKIRIASL